MKKNLRTYKNRNSGCSNWNIYSLSNGGWSSYYKEVIKYSQPKSNKKVGIMRI